MRQPLIVGNPVLVVVDIQEGRGLSVEQAGIPVMPGHDERVGAVHTSSEILTAFTRVAASIPPASTILEGAAR